MIRFGKLIFILIFISSSFYGEAQNIFDFAHTRNFAQYLMQTQQYQYAAEELERLLFYQPQNDSIKLQLIQLYRLGKSYEKGLTRTVQLWGSEDQIRAPFNQEYQKMLFLSEKYEALLQFSDKNNYLSESEKSDNQLNVMILTYQWKKAELLLNANPHLDLNLRQIIVDRNKSVVKSPAKAVILSCLLPGTGKIYTNEWQDGLLTMLIIAGNAWQSYRGFHKYGQNSAYGWIFGTLTVGFYGGNIYGAYKSAQNFNKNRDEKYVQKASSIIISKF